MEDISISKDTIRKAIKELKDNKTGGVDGFPSTVIITFIDVLVEPLYAIFNNSFLNHETPEDWRTANVTAILKSGNRKEASNY